MLDKSLLNANLGERKTVEYKNYEPPTYLIDEVELYFDLHEHETIVKSILRMRVNQHYLPKQNTLILNGEGLILKSLKLDDDSLHPGQYQIIDNVLIIPNTPDFFELEIITKIYPHKNTALIGLYVSENIFCTQCEAEGFRHITYYLDRPDVLARFTTTIEANKKKYPFLLSNGNTVDLGELPNDRHYVKWKDPFRKPCYLFALVAGDFAIYDDTFTTISGREVQCRIYVQHEYSDQTYYAMEALKAAMRWDEKTYGREYDLDIYMIVAIGDFNMGAMENKGLNIFNTKYILAKPATATDMDYIHILTVIGHEYFHNWSGNRVTCRDWFQLSLKEGLTIFRDQHFAEDLLSHGVMRIADVTALREVQFPEDASPLAHSVRPDSYIEINNFYTTTIYNKGAEIIRMLRTILGAELFRQGMDLYFKTYDGESAIIEDYIRCMEKVSNIDLAQFMLWYTQAGTPTVHVRDDYDAVKQIYSLTFSQTIPKTPKQASKKPMLIPIRLGLLDDEGQPVALEIGDEPKTIEKVFLLREETQSIHFHQLKAKPKVSLLRDFSAPVILDFTMTDADLLFLFKHDTDDFNRFEAGQKYMLRTLLNLVRDYQQHNPLHMPAEWFDVYRYHLQSDLADKFLLAELLSVPSERYIGEQMKIIDVNAIHAAREFAIVELAKTLQTDFLRVYKQHHVASYQSSERKQESIITIESMGKRKIKNTCLLFLLKLNNFTELGMEQFNQALVYNMSDTQTALTGLANQESPLRETALSVFYETYKNDPLVIDKWLTIQATSRLPDTLTQVKKLFRHEGFDIKNPNKVFALIGAFINRNPINFHQENGEGYAFLREVVHQLDKINPQMAAHMVVPLTRYQRYDKERENLMRKQLELLTQDKDLSPDVYELVSKSLANH